jgi:methyl-accepting chemotaxis protein
MAALSGQSTVRPRTVSATARQFERQQRARHAVTAADEATRQVSVAAAQHVASLSATVDDAHALHARARDLRASADLVREALERAKLLALNAGLEGARIGEPAGRVLATLADEVRTAAARGLEALADHHQLLGQVDRERERLGARLSETHDDLIQLCDRLTGVTAPHEAATQALDELELALRRQPGADPEAARAVTDAAEHARELLAALTRLSTRRSLLLRTLRPLLRQLLRMLDETESGTRDRD